MKRSQLIGYLEKFLDVGSFNDYCVNGLQVEGRDTVHKIVTGVSASERLFLKAVELKVDTIMVHHGLFWKNTPNPFHLTGLHKNRVKLLLQNDINLFGFHLPLDSHPEIGNNILLAKALNLTNVSLHEIRENTIFSGVLGELPSELTTDEFTKLADKELKTTGTVLGSTNRTIRKIYILSGGASGYYQQAVDLGADLMLTGELTESCVRAAEESGLAIYGAGHYNSEKLGITALGELLSDKFDLEVTFVDVPNPV